MKNHDSLHDSKCCFTDQNGQQGVLFDCTDQEQNEFRLYYQAITESNDMLRIRREETYKR